MEERMGEEEERTRTTAAVKKYIGLGGTTSAVASEGVML